MKKRKRHGSYSFDLSYKVIECRTTRKRGYVLFSSFTPSPSAVALALGTIHIHVLYMYIPNFTQALLCKKRSLFVNSSSTTEGECKNCVKRNK